MVVEGGGVDTHLLSQIRWVIEFRVKVLNWTPTSLIPVFG